MHFNFLGRDGDNARVKFAGVKDAQNVVSIINTTQELGLAINMGQVPGWLSLNKFGENPEIDTTSGIVDIWDGKRRYTWDANGTAPIMRLVSTNAADVQPITVYGLDVNGYDVAQTVTLQGTTPVQLTTSLWRVFRLENDGTVDVAGLVFAYVGAVAPAAVTDPQVRAIISDGNNQTLMALYTIPRGKVGFFVRGEIGMSRGLVTSFVRCAYFSRRYGKVFKVKKRIDLMGYGTSTYADLRPFPDAIPALTDISLTVEEVSANDTGVFGAFDILLVDSEHFSKAFLTSIGQPYPEDYAHFP